MSGSTTSDLARRLREADAAELAELVESFAGRLAPTDALQVLRNPFVSSEVIGSLLRQRELQNSYEVRRQAAGHPRTPQIEALRLVGTLFWRDLVRVGGDSRAHPVVRRAADQRLAERLPGLAAGEKAAIARRAGPGVIALLRLDPNVRVIAALLENPRLTEGLLLPLVSNDNARPQVLETIARSRRWGVRYGIKVPLCRNPRTPVPVSLSLLATLKKSDLAAVHADPRLAGPVRRRAALLLGRDP